MSVRYPVKEGPFSSHSQLRRLIRGISGTRMLDVGCGDGAFASKLLPAWEITGVELIHEEAVKAQELGIHVLNMPIEEGLSLIEGNFDLIIAADVLEHLQNPQVVLKALKSNLGANGKILISVPNVANIVIRLQLLFGIFHYTERGILDKTHLRFFTLRTLRQLVKSCDLVILEVSPTPLPIEMILNKFLPPILTILIQKILFLMTKIWKRGLAYQFVLVCEA